MTTLQEITNFLESFAPLSLSEEWDNTGLLIGDRCRSEKIDRVMTCLTLTPDVAEEAIAQQANLVVTHHPILFQAVQCITSDTTEGAMILKLIEANIAVYSPHTSYDSAQKGINQQIATSLGLTNIDILRPLEDQPTSGAGRYGDLSKPVLLSELNKQIKQVLNINALQFVGDADATISRIGIACGSAAEFLHDAKQHGCQALLTGEARFHACLEARSNEIALVIAGHYATERPAMEFLATRLQTEFINLKTWCSNAETDPVNWG